MRLIHSTTLTIKSFSEKDVPPYAILSHVWGSGEVSFKDMEMSSPPLRKLGFDKILKSCQQARSIGLEYIWIDTCCIDKSSSAELSEAINSMFRWYQEASLCYIYLDDFLHE
jgi:hypothetical protein